MRLTQTLLPSDAAALLEAQLPLFDAIERAASPEDREAAINHARTWLVQTAAQLRGQDPRSAPKPAPAPAAAAPAPARKPCGCDEPKSAPGKLGERAARILLDRFFPGARS